MSGSTTLVVQHWAVAFLDLLGQRRALGKMDFMPDHRDEEKVAELITAVKDSVGVIRSFFSLYETFQQGRDAAPMDLAELPEEFRKRAAEWRSTELKSLRFSDGLVVYSSLVPSPTHSPIPALYNLICASGSLMLMSLAMGHPMRGGLDVGTGIEADGQLYGPAVVKAYELESKGHGAVYPRIVVGKTLMDYVASQMGRAGDVWDQIDSSVAAIIRELLGQDSDGHTIVDYMGAGFKKRVSSAIDRSVVHRAQQFVANSLERSRREGNEKLAVRYERLATYFERRLDAWL